MAVSVLKIKAKLGELLPAKPPKERGQEGGRGKKKATESTPVAFDSHTIAAYRKIAANQ